MSVVLDDLDKAILKILQLDGRISFAKIARRLGIAEGTVRFRIKKLLKKGVIVRFVALLDPVKIGLNVNGAIMLKVDPAFLEKVSRKLASFGEISYVYQSTGEYDVIGVVYARDMTHLNELVRRAKMIRGVRDARVSVTTRFLKADPTFRL